MDLIGLIFSLFSWKFWKQNWFAPPSGLPPSSPANPGSAIRLGHEKRNAGLGDWANFYFWGKFFKNLCGYFFWVIFYFSGQKTEVWLFLGRLLPQASIGFFKSVQLVTNTLHLMLEIFLKITPPQKICPVTQSPSPKRIKLGNFRECR